MLVLKATKREVIDYLKRYASGLNGGRVKKSVWQSIDSVYRIIRDHTLKDAWHIELDQKETDDFPEEFLSPVIMENNLIVTVFLGGETSVYTKGRLKEGFRNAARLHFFPTDQPTDKTCVYFSVLDDSVRALYDTDYALRLLVYPDKR